MPLWGIRHCRLCGLSRIYSVITWCLCILSAVMDFGFAVRLALYQGNASLDTDFNRSGKLVNPADEATINVANFKHPAHLPRI